MRPLIPICIIVFSIGALAYTATKRPLLAHHSAQADETASGSDWDVGEERDKLTDKVTLAAQKVYETDGRSKIQVKAECINELNDIKFIFIDDTEELEQGFVAYRVDDGEVRGQPGAISQYNNVATLDFGATRIGAFALRGSEDTSPAELAKAKRLRVRLSVAGKNPADIQIDIAGLQEFLGHCPVTAPYLGQALSQPSNGVSTSPAQPAATAQSPTSPDVASHPDTGGYAPEQYMADHPYEKSVEASMTAPISPETAVSTPDRTTPAPAHTTAAALPVSSSEVDRPQVPRTTVAAPSINCNVSNKSTVDVLVCSNPQLLSTDAQINGAYYQLRHSLAPNAATSLKHYQKEWLARRGEQCGLKLGEISEGESPGLISCLQEMYNQRLSALQAEIQHAH